MGSFHELGRTDRLLPGDLLLIPPETPGSANRRMRLAPETLRRKYGFRVGAECTPYLGSLERALRTALYDEPQKPRWLLVTDLRVSRAADAADEMLTLNSADGEPDQYPVVDYVYAHPVLGSASASMLAATALLSSTVDPRLSYDTRNLLPASPLAAAMERLIASYAPRMQAVGSSNTLDARFRVVCAEISRVGMLISRLLATGTESASFTPNAIPSSDAGVYDFVEYACYSMERFDHDSKICLPAKFLRRNSGIRAYRLTEEAADAAAATVVRRAFVRARTELAATAAYATAIERCFHGMADGISALRAKMPEPERAEPPYFMPELEELQRAVECPPPPTLDAPFRAVVRVKAAALGVAA